MGGSGRYEKVDQNCFHEPASRDVMARSKLNDIQGLIVQVWLDQVRSVPESG